MKRNEKKHHIINSLKPLLNTELVKDAEGNEFVLPVGVIQHPINEAIKDKTGFEGFNTHTHLTKKVKSERLIVLKETAIETAEILKKDLTCKYPQKNFIIYITITIGGSMIIRFHQQWDGEQPYYDEGCCDEDTMLLIFKSCENGYECFCGTNLKTY